MSRRNKLAKFAELRELPNVFENYTVTEPSLTHCGQSDLNLRGKWASDHFGNNHPLVLECACGRGEYTIDLARQFPERNFIGIDIKGARIWTGAKNALEAQLSNAAFLRTRIEVIGLFFAPGEVDEIWITFPDPFLKDSKANRRLTSHYFLDQYKKIIKPGGSIHLKTDEGLLYDFSLEVLAERKDYEIVVQERDLYGSGLESPELEIKTYYEQLNISRSKTIKYLKFRFLG